MSDPEEALGDAGQHHTRTTSPEDCCAIRWGAQLDEWRQGSRESVGRLADALGAGTPEEAVDRPYTLLTPVHDLLSVEDLASLSDDDFMWLLTHVIAFTAEYIIHEYGGNWFVDAGPDSPSFKKFVVTGFPAPAQAGSRIDVDQHVTNFFNETLSWAELHGPARVARRVDARAEATGGGTEQLMAVWARWGDGDVASGGRAHFRAEEESLKCPTGHRRTPYCVPAC